MSLIRSNASMVEVKSCIEQELDQMSRSGREPTPEYTMLENEIRRESQIDRHRSAVSIHMLVDMPLVRVSAASWTKATHDNLVSNLISVWSTWDKIWYNWLDEIPYLRDMGLSH
ncbi:uncharacterized protein Z519_08839 [Cladophialophora bantiana CBS 173.52]|uniref:Uncharacterized protein n=1 Tax=Cladophialophora bantiana (strain ATCC 10958 / CBS 173.52 / CDC B-1940 / NIH 8579) TaxID=1442370 RepID=A0A0D2EJH6_CLAB1|nr:uncharacterized protein Z519_08839 [Cladophialophora bantiana CBS 173.52]KIW90196.1 hypothetical protein Z519_08839 [Cladophialophora bantiana CBS 173.52]